MCYQKRCLHSICNYKAAHNQNMEQNQKSDLLSPTQQQWRQLRQQFADSEESIQDEQGVQLMQQWINLKYNNQFQQYGQMQNDPEKGKSLKDVIREVIASEKQTNWIITQKYTLEHAQHLISKAKQIYLHYQDQKQAEPEPMQVQAKDPTVRSRSRRSSSKNSKRPRKQNLNHSTLLPEIKPKGKIYNVHQLSSNFQLLQETTQQYKPRSPHIFQNEPQRGQAKRNSLFGNRFLIMAFYKFCKQAYNYRGLFSQMSREEDKMNMNKWMVFCKEFDFNQKFHSKDLIEIYQVSTKFASTMNLDQFLSAVVILQQKYIDRFHTGEFFVQEILKINSEAAFRAKMQNLKVSYSGPKRNSFEMGAYPQPLRLEQMQRQKQFQNKKRQKEIVLIQGMYEEHLRDQIKKRKQIREQKKKDPTLLNQSFIKNKSLVKEASQQYRYSTKSPQKANYSNIFQRGKQSTQLKQKQLAQFTDFNNNSLYKTEGIRKSQKAANQFTKMKENGSKKQLKNNSVSKTAFQTKINPEKNLQDSKIEARRQWPQPNDAVWMTRIRSDSQQSDEILKEHLQLQKQIKSKQSLNVRKWVKDMQLQPNKVQAIKQRVEDDQLAQTRANLYQNKVQ